MPRGSKDKYTDKQKRKARHIEEGYEQRGVSEDEAERRAWATVNEQDGGGRKGGRKPARKKQATSKSGGTAARRRKSAGRGR